MIFGIDPGYSGAICEYHSAGEGALLAFHKMPIIGASKARDYDIKAIETMLLSGPKAIHIESADTFALHAATVRSLVRCVTIWEVLCSMHAGVPVHVVRAQTWQKLAFEGTPSEMKPKERARIAARRIFAGSDTDKWTEGQRDAALIAWYGARQA